MPSGAHDYYGTLGVPRTASSDELRKAHRKLARRYHPDLHPANKLAEERFRKVQEAYDVLSDADARRKYDQTAFDSETVPAGTPAGATGGAGARPAARVDPFARREWVRWGAAPNAGLRDYYAAPRDNKMSRTDGGVLAFLLVCGFVGTRILPSIATSRTMASLGCAGYAAFVPIGVLFALGFLFGGARGSFLARCALINAAAWCCLVLYCWGAEILPWPEITHILPWALPTHTPIILGMYFRRGGIN
jgi:hypothetical protein